MCVNHEYNTECLATFAKEVDGEGVTLQIAEFGEDIEIVVENTEGSVQYVLDCNNHFQVTEIDEDNILNEIVDVLEKSDLYLPDSASLKMKTLDPFLREIEDFTNYNDVDHLIDNDFVPLDFNLDDLSGYLKYLDNSTDVSTPIDLKTEATVLLEDCAITKRFGDRAIASSSFEDNIEDGEIINFDVTNEYFEDIVYRNDKDTREDGEILYYDDNKENVEEIIYSVETETRCNDAARIEPAFRASLRSVRKKIWTCNTCQFVALTKRVLTQHERQHAPKKPVRKTKNASSKVISSKRSNSSKHHLKCVPKNRKKVCPHCKKTFHDIYAYELHLIYHENRKYID